MSSMLVLGGRYRLLNRLGRSDTSVVWRGYDQVRDRAVAVKLLAGDATGAAGRELARAEVRTATQLSHPHVCHVYDHGESPAESGDRVAYLVMELLSGSTLEERLRAGPLPVAEALRVTAQVASALAAAHSCGLVHRNITPANIMLTPAGPKIVDFGIAVSAGAPDLPDPDPDPDVRVTPAYLAPERLLEGRATPASDVYALGLVVYRMVSGSEPWPAETVTRLLETRRYQEPAPLPPVDGLSEPVADLCQRCLARDPRERPTAHEVVRRLAEAIGWRVSRAGEELIEVDDPPSPVPAAVATGARPEQPESVAVSPPPAPPSQPPPPAPGDGTNGRAPRLHVKRHHRRRPVLVAVAAVVAALAGLTGAAWMADRSTDRYEAGGPVAPAGPPVDVPVTHPAGAGTPLPDGTPTDPARTGRDEPRDAAGDASPEPPDPGDRGSTPPDAVETPRRDHPRPVRREHRLGRTAGPGTRIPRRRTDARSRGGPGRHRARLLREPGPGQRPVRGRRADQRGPGSLSPGAARAAPPRSIWSAGAPHPGSFQPEREARRLLGLADNRDGRTSRHR